MCRPSDPSRHPYTLRWTTELALRPGSPSTTIPPFVRRMYSGGALWTTTGVRQIHYPFIPVDANISMVFTAIPNRIPSVAPGVTYKDSGDTWRQVFHYPTDSSSKPPEAIAYHPDNHPLSSVTLSSPMAVDSSPKVTVAAILAEWDDVDGQDFLDGAFSDSMRHGAHTSATKRPGLVGSKAQDPQPGFWPREDDASEAPVIQGDGVNRVTAPLQLPQDLGNTESDYDNYNNTDSTPSPNNAPLHQDQGVDMGHGSLLPTGGASLEDESMLLTDNIQHDNDSLSLMNNDTLEGYLFSTTNDDTQSDSSSTVTTTQDSDDAMIQNSSLQPTNNPQDGSFMLASADVNGTSHSPRVQDTFLMVSPTLKVLLEQSQSRVGQSAGSVVTQEIWHSDGATPGTEPFNDLSVTNFLVLSGLQSSGASTEQPQVLEPSTEQVVAPTKTIHPNIQQGTPRVTTVRIQTDVSTVTVRPSTPALRVQSSTSTVRVQPGDATLAAHLGVFDLIATKSSSQVT